MSHPEEYELIATLWYSTRENKEPTFQVIYYKTKPLTTADASILSLYTNPGNPLGFGPLGNDFTILYEGVRTLVNNANSAITFPSFKETFIVNVPSGSLKASAVYYDRGSGFETVVNENIFTVSGGSGLFNDASIAIINYDNSGEKFGKPFSRRIEVFKLKKLLE